MFFFLPPEKTVYITRINFYSARKKLLEATGRKTRIWEKLPKFLKADSSRGHTLLAHSSLLLHTKNEACSHMELLLALQFTRNQASEKRQQQQQKIVIFDYHVG